jgi:phage-related protein
MGATFQLMGEISLNNKKAKDAVNEVDKEAKEASAGLQDKFKKGAAIASAAITGIAIAGGVMAVKSAASAQAVQAQFEQVFGDVQGKASEVINGMAAEFDMVPTRLTPAMSQMTSMFKGLGLDTEDAMKQAEIAVRASADAAAFYDVSFESASGSLKSFIKGNYEGGEAIGIFANDTQMASFAISNGVVKNTGEWQKLDEATKQATRLEYAKNMQDQAGATGQAARESDSLENQMGNLKETWDQALASIGSNILPTAIGVIQKLANGIKWLATDGKPTAVVLGAVVAGIWAITTAITVYNAVMPIATAVSTAFGVSTLVAFGWIILIVAGIALFIAAIVSLIQNWDAVTTAISAVAQAIWGVISTVFTTIWNFISGIFTAIWNTISGVLNAIWGVVSTVFNAIWGFISGILTTIGGFVSSAFNAYITVITTVMNAINGVISTVLNAVSGFISGIFNTIKNVISTVMNAISSIISTVWNAISSAVTGIVTGIANTIMNIWNGLVSSISGVLGVIRDTVSNAFDGIRDAITNVFNGIGDVVTGIWNGIAGAIRGGINFVIDGINSFLSGINSIKIPDWVPGVGGMGISIPLIPRLAKGGIAMDSMFANIGEGRDAEAVIPLNRNTLAGIGAGISASTPQQSNTELVKLLTEIKEQLKQTQIIMNSGVLVGEIKRDMTKVLNDDSILRNRGVAV